MAANRYRCHSNFNLLYMIVKIKKLHDNAVVPHYAKQGDAGLDLTATSKYVDTDGNVVYGTGIALEIPAGYVGLVFPRSSNAEKMLLLTNSVGVIDSGYRGEICLKYRRMTDTYYCRYKGGNMPEYSIGERIGQIIILPYPSIEFSEVNELAASDRGAAGYGSSGK